MKRLGKSSKKGFTLVELIVVLVILAVLAAMLVPALVGYIDKAKKEKEFQSASTVYAAAQAVVTEAYGKGDIDKAGKLNKTGFTLTGSTLTPAAAYGSSVIDLAGLDTNAVEAYEFNFGSDYIIGSSTAAKCTAPSDLKTGESMPTNAIGYVKMADAYYFLEITNGAPKWTACAHT